MDLDHQRNLNLEAMMPAPDEVNLEYTKKLYSESEHEALTEIYDLLQGSVVMNLVQDVLIENKSFYKNYLGMLRDYIKQNQSVMKDPAEIIDLLRKQCNGLFQNRYTGFHEPRSHDKYHQEYRNTKQLFNELNIGCFICGITKKDIDDYNKDSQEVLMAEGHHEPLIMQLHHYFVEFSYSGAIDLALFNNHYVPLINNNSTLKNYLDLNPAVKISHQNLPAMKQLEQINYVLQPLKNQDELLKFITSHPYNMMSLCTTHHRSDTSSIHELVYPYWLIQQALTPLAALKQNFLNLLMRKTQRQPEKKEIKLS